MTMKKRTFTKEDKLWIIKEVSGNGVNPTIEKCGIYRAFHYTLKRKIDINHLPAEKEPEDKFKGDYLKKKLVLDKKRLCNGISAKNFSELH